MKVAVHIPRIAAPDGETIEVHEGDEVIAGSEGGELVIHVRDIHRNPVHWARYAAHMWTKVELVEGMSQAVAAARDAQQHNSRPGSPAAIYPAASALPSGAVAGNTGPGY